MFAAANFPGRVQGERLIPSLFFSDKLSTAAFGC